MLKRASFWGSLVIWGIASQTADHFGGLYAWVWVALGWACGIVVMAWMQWERRR